METVERIIYPFDIKVESVYLDIFLLKRIYWNDFRSWGEVYKHF